MAIQMRRGLRKDFDPNKMLPGEWAVSIDSVTSNQIVWMCFAAGVCKRMGTYEDFQSMVAEIAEEIKADYVLEFNAIKAEIQSVANTAISAKNEVLIVKSDITNTYLPQIQQYVSDAQTAANTATSKATDASNSASAAKTSETNAKKSESNASTSEKNASSSAAAAKSSETNATTASDSASKSASTATQMASDASAYANNAKASADTANTHAETASENATAAANSANTATSKANSASESAVLAESYAVGATGIRENENVDNAKYYYEQSKKISQGLNGIVPMGTVTFANLPTENIVKNAMYNISDGFVSDERFNDGGGVSYGSGNNVIWTADGLWDVTAASGVNGVKGANENTYRQGFVNITPENIGALPEDGNASDTTIAYTQASSRENVNTGEKQSVLFGKIKKWFADMTAAAFAQMISSYSDLMSNTVSGYIPDAKAVKDGFDTVDSNLVSISYVKNYWLKPVTEAVSATWIVAKDGTTSITKNYLANNHPIIVEVTIKGTSNISYVKVLCNYAGCLVIDSSAIYPSDANMPKVKFDDYNYLKLYSKGVLPQSYEYVVRISEFKY